MELRREIASLFAVARRAGADNKPGDPEDFADLVLAIPEIRDALNGVRPVGGYWERTGTGKGARKWVPAP